MSSRKTITVYTLLIFIFFLLSPGSKLRAATNTSAADTGCRWVMAVGICKFADTRIPKLTYCGDDARTIVDYFKADRIPAEQIVLLINEEADKVAIIGGLQKISREISPDDSLFFFYSSHGAGDQSGTTYFITFDTVGDDLAKTALPMQELKEMIESIKCRNIVMMIDTCHSGGVKSLGSQDEKAYEKLVRSANKKTRIAILTSSRTHESSMESDRWKHGAFTYYMLDGLSGSADNFPKDQHVSVTELFDYVMIAVPRATKRAQHPSAKFSYNWPGDKEKAVEVGKIRHDRTQPETADPNTPLTNPAAIPQPEVFTVIDTNGWKNSGHKKSDKTDKRPNKNWHNIVD